MFPLFQELSPAPDVSAVFRRLAHKPYPLLFDSAMRFGDLGRYSFMCCDPFLFLSSKDESVENPLARIQQVLDSFRYEYEPHTDRDNKSAIELPPFIGGAAGIFSYDFNRQLEEIFAARFDEFEIPEFAVGFYDVVVAWDHQTDRAWVISQGFPEVDESARLRHAKERMAQVLSWIESTPTEFRVSRSDSIELSPQFNSEIDSAITSNFSKADYYQAISKAIEYIYEGDIFQVNIAQRLLTQIQNDPAEIYLQLRSINPAPFATYFDIGSHQILSASPERFIQIKNGTVETRPIKGTRRRTFYPEADLLSALELEQNEKDRSENVMIVDLLRNDLSKICEPDSVKVTQLCKLENYQYVKHLVSAVEGKLLPNTTALDMIAGTFPGGSITGAPKVRAMEIISELEPNARGAYCGSMGYIGFDEQSDFNILIRTMTLSHGYCQMPVGGGIVADSTPEREYVETLEKATGMVKTIQSLR